MAEKKSIIEWIEAMPREVIYTIMLIVLIIPLIRPLGIPVPVSARIKEWHEFIQNLPEGSYVLVSIDYGAGTIPTFEPFMLATMHDLFSRPLKIVIMTTYADGPICYKSVMDKLKPEETYGKKYGEDYVFLGYIPGGETAMKAIGENLPKAVPMDFYRTPIDQIPMLKGITGAKDFAVVVTVTPSGDVSEGWIRQWVTPYGTPYLCCVLAMMEPTMMPYYQAGQCKALCTDAHAGEYEFLIGKPGEGIKKLDAFSLSLTVLAILIIIANILYFVLKAGGKK
ncbi:MAG: hypothetical protein DRJ21_01030 [Candidatus Methanomethylicota archaeon]|uniref:Uncharacterized protein n=1 Tax=Thermoproteota archaeon TaxID=2056631 RepID=A0A497EUT4_9CREN|nr:MAG: hypothetical protein DRJ21_01030 [Candidatus Verstraetearchaeota archaeon]